ncbi:MAG TPA: SEC-C metal-binding domain-containing protein, partial [Acidimicrobiales bacterium]
GEDLREHTLELLDAAVDTLVESYCTGYQEEWDLDGLLTELTLYYPTKFTADGLRGAVNADEVHESLFAEAVRYYEGREQAMPVPEGGQPGDTMRQLEREVMLQIIDTKWREHLAEMDYLREGINLRAMGQQDPLVAWQREGYEMFGRMVAGIDDDYLKYVMHVEVLVDKPAEPDLRQARYEAADDPVQGQSGMQQAALQAPPAGAPSADGGQQAPAMAQATMQPVLKSEEEKLGRNQPCYCGSGKKYKMCHGR